MRINFLGTNGWYDSETGDTVCVLIDSREGYFILDAGNAFYKIDRYIRSDKPVFLFLSHFHLDHIYGLHILNKFNFKQGIDIFGPAGLKRALACVINAPYSMPIKKLKTKIRIHELKKHSPSIIGNVEFRKFKHSTVCLGYRLNLEGKVVAYCTDTGVCKNISYIARGADLLITECSYLPGYSDPSWPHLNPETAGQIARDSGVQRLALLHFDAGVYTNMRQRIRAGNYAKKFFKNTFVAKDDLSFVV